MANVADARPATARTRLRFMHSRLLMPRWGMIAIALPLWLCAPARAQPEAELRPGGAQVDEDQTRRIILQLASEDFTVRQHAARRLRETGRAALPLLESAALESPTDVAAQIVALLEQMFVFGCPDLADEAERTLERIAATGDPNAGRRARIVLVGNQQLRQKRAIAAIREYGGKVDYLDVRQSQGNIFFAPPDQGIEIPGQSPAIIRIWLLEDWTGGTEGLWHVGRLEDSWSARLWGMEVTNVRGNGLKSEDVQALAARLPRVRILERGASLGIQCHSLDPCQVMEIVPEGAAERAGILAGDIIRRLDETRITSFNDLVNELLNRNPNENVTLQIDRYGRLMQVEVTLGGWRNLVTGRDEPPEPNDPLPDLDRGPLFPQPDLGPER